MELEDVLRDGERALTAAVAEQQLEHLSLDFKEPGRGSGALFADGKLTRQGQLVVGEAISAFANSAGGILVIGVRCKPDGGIDAASELVPITDLKRSHSALSGQLGAMLQPRHEGLRLYAVQATEPEDAGYLVIDVPRSERRPHMAQMQRHYFKRSGASTFAMEHYDIEDAFRRFTSPTLDLQFEFKRGGVTADGRKAKFIVDLALHNPGEVSASAPHIVFEHPIEGGLYHLDTSLELSEFRNSTTMATNGDFVVHPQQTKSVGKLVFWAVRGLDGSETMGGEHDGRGDFVTAKFTVSAKDMRPISGHFHFYIETVRQNWPRSAE